MPSLLTPTPPKAPKSNWGTGSQPARRTTAEIERQRVSGIKAPTATPNTLLTPTPPQAQGRNLGTMTSADLSRNPTGVRMDQRPVPTGNPVTSGYTEYTPRSPLTMAAPRAPAPLAPIPSAPVAAPTTVAAPQTESANPLTGTDNQRPAGVTAPVNPAADLGFSRAGAGVPRGQDAAPAGAKTAGGTGLYRRSFANPRSAGLYDGYIRKLFSGPATV